MPFPNEHAARIIEPSEFEPKSFRRKKITDGVDVIMGKLKGKDSMTIQTYRFDKDKFTAEEAKAWLKRNDVKAKSFEEAGNTKNEGDDMPEEIKTEEPTEIKRALLNEDIQTSIFLEEVTTKEGKKQYKGKVKVAQKADTLNRNRRIYPEKVLQEAVGRLKEKLKKGPIPMYNGHRTADGKSINDLNEIVALINDVNYHQEDKTVSLDDITFVETQAGKDLIALAEAGLPLQASQNGSGTSHLIKHDDGKPANMVDILDIDGWDALRAGKASVTQADMEFHVLSEEAEMPENILTEEQVDAKLTGLKETILNEIKNVKPAETPAEPKPAETPKPEIDKTAEALANMQKQVSELNEAVETNKREKGIQALIVESEKALNEALAEDKYKAFDANGKKQLVAISLKDVPKLYDSVDTSKPDEFKTAIGNLLNEHVDEWMVFMANQRLAGMGYGRGAGNGIQHIEVINEHFEFEEKVVKLNEAIEDKQVMEKGNHKFFTDAEHPVMKFGKRVENMMIKEFYERKALNEANELQQSTISVTLLTVGLSMIRAIFPRLSALQVCSLGTMTRLLDQIIVETFSTAISSNAATNLDNLTVTELNTLGRSYVSEAPYNIVATQKARSLYITDLAIATAKGSIIDPVANGLDRILNYFQTVINGTIWAVMIAKTQEYDHGHVTGYETLTANGAHEWYSAHEGWIRYEYVKDETGNPASAKLIELVTGASGNTMQIVDVREGGDNNTPMVYGTDYVVDWAKGSIILTDAGEIIEASNGVEAKYSYTNNLKTWSVVLPTGVDGIDHLTNLGLMVDQAGALVRNRHYTPNFIGMNYNNNARVGRSTDFTNAGSRIGNVMDMNGETSRYCGFPVSGDTMIDDCWMIIGTQGKAVYRIHTPMKVKGPIPIPGQTDDEYQFSQFDAIDSPEGGAFTLVGIKDLLPNV